ncbi:hypothetical protein GIS00_09485 [Nakamurella sp. YIM 132087]|uniref:Uncharacterized protein n=1 Tax=Nakamurella alba TaxID=2665158 RepID=A0A7K1FJD2_9ACTN|nr:hypothetical protein [Nakamurella alba]MTD14176.1 hypothetical protein [Nakamurella alba]
MTPGAMYSVAPPPVPARVTWTDHLVIGAAAALVGFFVLFAAEAPIGRSVGFAAMTAVVAVICSLLVRRIAPPRRPPGPPEPQRRTSVRRWEFAGLGDLLHQGPTEEQERARVRLRALVADLLSARGIDFPSERAEALLGGTAYRQLSDPGDPTGAVPPDPRVPRPSAEDRRALVDAVLALARGAGRPDAVPAFHPDPVTSGRRAPAGTARGAS